MTITVGDIWTAYRRIAPYIRPTPLESSPGLSAQLGFPVSLKMESHQVTGSFKARGAFNKVLTLLERGNITGLVAPTVGGHGVGISHAAKRLGVPAQIYVPKSIDPSKRAVIESHGALLRIFDDMAAARAAAESASRECGLDYCSAYDDACMIEAGGTVALEILKDAPDVDLVITGVGGGGLIAGMARVLKQIRPSLRIIGVQPACSAPLGRWHAAGRPIEISTSPSFAEGIGARIAPETITWPYIRDEVDGFVLVEEAELKDAMAWMLAEHHEVIEGAAAASIAGLRKWQAGDQAPKRAVAVITGKNIDKSRYLDCIAPNRGGNEPRL